MSSQDSCNEKNLSCKQISIENFQIENIEKSFFDFQSKNLLVQQDFFDRIQTILKEIQEISSTILRRKLEMIGFEMEYKVKYIQESLREQGNSLIIIIEMMSSKLQEFLKSTELFLSEFTKE